MNEKVKAFYGDPKAIEERAPIRFTSMKNKCPVCGKEFFATPPLTPNTTDKEFYGGRIKFFKDVECDCTAKYRLCIERRYNSIQGADELHVIDMLILRDGIPLDVIAQKKKEKEDEELKEEIAGKILEETEKTGNLPSLHDRQEIKKQTVLATIIDLDAKIDTLCYHTKEELQIMCKRRKLKFNKKASKKQLAEILLAYDPSLVSADF